MSISSARDGHAGVDIGRVRTDDAPSGDFWLRAFVVASVAMLLSARMGWTEGAFGGLLVDTDSYTRISRLMASLEAGALLDHIPRDNGGTAIALHWSHLLEGLILLLALPLWPFVGQAEALRLAGAALGPLGVAAAALSAMYAACILGAGRARAMATGILAALGPAIVSYGAFGRADHHVLLGALAILAPALAYADGAGVPARPAIWSGIAAGLGIWLSPEALPFALLAWAVAIIGDIDAGGRLGDRARDFCLAFLAIVMLAMLIDPPSSGRLGIEMDRLSRPFAELALLMTAVTLLARRLPALTPGWPAAIGAGAIALGSLVPWLLLYPGVLRGAEGVFSPEAWTRIWRTNSEMRSPLWTASDSVVFFAIPAAILALAMAMLLWRRRRPIDLLALAGAAFIAYMACRHIRLTIYLQLAAAVAAALLLDRLASALPPARRRIAIVLATLCLALAPWLGGMAVPASPPQEERRGGCDPRAVAGELAPFAGRVVLSWVNDAPALLYFSKIITVASPYHRAERRIFDVMDAFAEKSFADRAPASFRRTGASAILVCTTQSHQPGSLGETLARGQPPSWLAEVPIAPASRYRLYAVR